MFGEMPIVVGWVVEEAPGRIHVLPLPTSKTKKTPDECAPSGSWARPFVSFFEEELGAAPGAAVPV